MGKIKTKSLIGKRIGNLKVLMQAESKKSPNGHVKPYVVCLCDCGNKIIVRTDNLLAGTTSRCSECNNNRGASSRFCEIVEGEIVELKR